MNPLKKKLATIMIASAYDEINKIEKDSPQLKDLKAIDMDKAIEEDVNRICEVISMGEIMRLMPLIAKWKMTCESGEQDEIKCRIREIGLKVVERVECEGGKLKLPASCRDLLMEL